MIYTIREFDDWMRHPDRKTGDEECYHIGRLANDRQVMKGEDRPHVLDKAKRIRDLADYIFECADARIVATLQTKHRCIGALTKPPGGIWEYKYIVRFTDPEPDLHVRNAAELTDVPLNKLMGGR